jgi:hypothetical protein
MKRQVFLSVSIFQNLGTKERPILFLFDFLDNLLKYREVSRKKVEGVTVLPSERP